MPPLIKRLCIICLTGMLFLCPSCGNSSPVPGGPEEDNTPATVISTPAPLSPEELRHQLEVHYDIIVVFGNNDIYTLLFDYEPLTDKAMIQKGLELLEAQLARYPQGFFTGLRIDKTIPFHFIFSGNINNVFSQDRAGGVCTEANGMHIILLFIDEGNWGRDWGGNFLPTGDPFMEYALHHEIGHAVDYIIQRLSTGTPFSPDEWNRLLPPKFLYDDMLRLRLDDPFANVSTPDYVFAQSPGETYFYDRYSKVNLEENIASLFGYAMCGNRPAQAMKSPHIQAQMRYYFPIIRNRFSDSSWPATTYWEEALNF